MIKKASASFTIFVLLLGLGGNFTSDVTLNSLDIEGNIVIPVYAESDESENSDNDDHDARNNDDNDEAEDEKAEDTEDEKAEDTEDEKAEDTEDEKAEDTEDEKVEDTEDEKVEDTEDEIQKSKPEIEVKIKHGKTKITIESETGKSKFLLDTTDENTIVSAITNATGLSEPEIKNIWEFEIEESDDPDLTRENEARQEAQNRIAELEQKISQLEQRVQTLLQKIESGKYYFGQTNAVPEESFSISFDGSVTSMDNTVTEDMTGEIFVDSISTKHGISMYQVTGGELFVGGELYDVVVGKMRVLLPGNPTAKGTVLLIGEIMDERGDVRTLRMSLTADGLGEDSTEPVKLQVLSPQSKIAGQWFLSGSGHMSQLFS